MSIDKFNFFCDLFKKSLISAKKFIKYAIFVLTNGSRRDIICTTNHLKGIYDYDH